MQEKNIPEYLFTKGPYQLVSSFYSDLPDIQLEQENLEWHKQHSEKHAYREILLVLSGSVVQQLNNVFYRIPEHTLLLVNHHESHTFGYDNESEGLHCWIVLLPGELLWNFAYCKNGAFSYVRRGGLPRSELYNALERCWMNYSNGMSDLEKKAYVSEMHGLLSLLLIHIGRQFTNPQRQPQQSNEECARLAIQRVAAYLHENCGCNEKTMARMAGYSQVHFVRLFKHYTGMNPKQYINTIRYRKYAELKGKMPVKQLAEKMGFSSSSALAHWLSLDSSKLPNQGKHNPQPKE